MILCGLGITYGLVEEEDIQTSDDGDLVAQVHHHTKLTVDLTMSTKITQLVNSIDY